MSSKSPLNEFQIGRTPLDVILIGERENVGAPLLTTFVDAKTKAIVRFTITEETVKDEPESPD
ncbi:hypothetical protein D3C84_396510 [compost metagenome]